MPKRSALAALLIVGAAGAKAQDAPVPRQPDEIAGKLAGTWELAVDNRSQACRLLLRAQKSDKGDYFLGMPPACRHTLPFLAKVGRWGLPDATHLTLQEPGGTPVLTLAAAGDGFAATGSRVFTLKRVGGADAADTLDGPVEPAIVPVVHRQAEPAPEPAAVRETAVRAPVVRETAADLAGRYAVMREKRDTGCMLTLDDKTRAKGGGGNRAQLAPGCRDQGIVIFDPAGWALVKGELVLTARAGHKAKLEHKGEGAWARDAADGGKPLGLKKL